MSKNRENHGIDVFYYFVFVLTLLSVKQTSFNLTRLLVCHLFHKRKLKRV